MKVADKVKDRHGVEWVIAKIFEHENHFDYELINTETGEHGCLREEVKTNVNES